MEIEINYLLQLSLIYRVGQKKVSLFIVASNFVHCQPTFIIFGTVSNLQLKNI